MSISVKVNANDQIMYFTGKDASLLANLASALVIKQNSEPGQSVHLVCAECGERDNLGHDAMVSLDPYSGDYEIVSILDDTWCNCGADNPTLYRESNPPETAGV